MKLKLFKFVLILPLLEFELHLAHETALVLLSQISLKHCLTCHIEHMLYLKYTEKRFNENIISAVGLHTK